MKSYSQMINKFTKEFANDFCNDNGEIEWEKLVRYNSESIKLNNKNRDEWLNIISLLVRN
jgi:hypothetical protein